MASFERPVARRYNNVKDYFDRTKPLCPEESYIYHQDDILTIMPDRDTTWLDHWIEDLIGRFQCRLMKYIFSPKSMRRKADPSTGIIMYSRSRIKIVVTLIVLIIITALFVVPVYIPWHLTRDTQSTSSISIIIVVLIVFTLLFSSILLKFTRAKRHEILAAAAAYCAVLVTFMGSVGQISGK